MQTGFNLLLWTTHLTDDLLPVCERLKAAGYDGVEIPVFEGEPAHFAALGRRLDDIGLRRTSVGVVPGPEANPMSLEPTSHNSGIDHLKWMVDCSAAAGAEVVCGPFFQPLGTFSGRGPTEAETDAMIRAHRAMAEHAQGTGVRIAVEPLNRFECYGLNTLAQASRVVEAVGAEIYGCLFDTFHANIEERDVGAAIRQAGRAINHVHISENDRGVPGRGHVNFAETFAALNAIGYDGWLVIEAFGQALPDLTAATRVWRPLFEREEDVYREGLALMQDGWSKATERKE